MCVGYILNLTPQKYLPPQSVDYPVCHKQFSDYDSNQLLLPWKRSEDLGRRSEQESRVATHPAAKCSGVEWRPSTSRQLTRRGRASRMERAPSTSPVRAASSSRRAAALAHASGQQRDTSARKQELLTGDVTDLPLDTPSFLRGECFSHHTEDEARVWDSRIPIYPLNSEATPSEVRRSSRNASSVSGNLPGVHSGEISVNPGAESCNASYHLYHHNITTLRSELLFMSPYLHNLFYL